MAAADINLERGLRGSAIGNATAVTGQDPPPTVDIRDEGAGQAMWEAAHNVGFFTVTGHGIPQELIADGLAASKAFFAQPREAKASMSPFAPQLNSGYEYMSQIRPSTGTPDQKESIQLTARSGAMDGRWPTEPTDFESRAKVLMNAAHSLGCRILSILEPLACPSLEAGTLAKAHTLWGEDGQCTLRLLHYPPTEVPTLKEGEPQLWRAGPHTDWCCVTLLFQQPGNEGLECAANPRAGNGSPEWVAVDPVEGGIAINIGDMLSRWSDGRLLSNLHRVRMPTAAEASPPRSRFSMAFFMQADKKAIIQSEANEPITAGDYILQRIRSNFAATAANTAAVAS